MIRCKDQGFLIQSWEGVVFVHDAPLAVELLQAHREAEFEGLSFAGAVDADAISLRWIGGRPRFFSGR